MSQFDFGVIDPKGTSGRQLAILMGQWRDALNTSFSGPARPDFAVAGFEWIDTSGSEWLIKRYDGTSDLVMGSINPTTHAFAPVLSQTAAEGILSAASVTDLASTPAFNVAITGGGTIGSFGNGKNQFKVIRFTSVVTITNGTTLVIPNGTIATAVNDIAIAMSDASANWRICFYQRANGKAIAQQTFASVDIRKLNQPPLVSMTANKTLTYDDAGSAVRIEATGTVVTTFPDATNPAGPFYVQNLSNSSQTLKQSGGGWFWAGGTGAPTFTMRAKTAVIVVGSGGDYFVFAASGSSGLSVTTNYYSSDTWINPKLNGANPDAPVIIGPGWGGGGGRGNQLTLNGGGAGAPCEPPMLCRLGDLPDSFAITIGAGGPAGSYGGQTSAGDFYICNGGAVGDSGSVQAGVTGGVTTYPQVGSWPVYNGGKGGGSAAAAGNGKWGAGGGSGVRGNGTPTANGTSEFAGAGAIGGTGATSPPQVPGGGGAGNYGSFGASVYPEGAAGMLKITIIGA